MNTAHVHLGLARNSDWAFTSAVVVLVVALLLLAVPLAGMFASLAATVSTISNSSSIFVLLPMTF